MTKSIYSTPQKAFLGFNPGTGKQVEKETQQLLSNLYLKTKYTPLVSSVRTTDFEISAISLYSLVEVLMRSQTAQDLRLEIASDEVYLESSFRKFCDHIPWDAYLQRSTSVHLRVKSQSSRLFHESMLRDILADRLSKKINVKFIKGDDDSDVLTTIYADVQKNQCSMSISLAGLPLYQRGFRETGGAVAPLREDIAQTCIREALEFCRKRFQNFTVHNLWVPFGGTGTLIFEYLMHEMNIAPSLLGRSYALQNLAFFNEKNFGFVMAKAVGMIVPSGLKKIFYSDYAYEAYEAFTRNLGRFREQLKKTTVNDLLEPLSFNTNSENFFSGLYPEFEAGDVFIPINPPYGLRMHSSSEIPALYSKIAEQLLAAKQSNSQNTFGGFILCPSEEAWSAFSRVIAPHAELETSHITQGGIDVRVCLFVI